MELDEFIETLFDGLVENDTKLENIKKAIKENIDFENVKVETQLFTDENNYDLSLNVSNEGYSDGEILFLDYRVI